MDFIPNAIDAWTDMDYAQASQFTTVLLIAFLIFVAYIYWRGKKQNTNIAIIEAQAEKTRQKEQINFNLKVLELATAQVNNNDAIALLVQKDEESRREISKLISGLTTAVTKFTRTVSDQMERFGKSIEELEATIITHIEQEQRNHDALISSQSFHSDGVTGLRNEISALTGQISVLINSIHTRDTANSDVRLTVDNLASEVKLLTQAVEARQAITENENKPLEASNE